MPCVRDIIQQCEDLTLILHPQIVISFVPQDQDCKQTVCVWVFQCLSLIDSSTCYAFFIMPLNSIAGMIICTNTTCELDYN